MTGEERDRWDSRALEPELITDLLQTAAVEARNGFRQYDAAIGTIHTALERGSFWRPRSWSVLLLLTMLGLFGPGQVTALGSIALILGGIVSLGSNVSTLQQTSAAIGAAENLRSQLIGRIDLRVVGDAPMKLM